MSRRTERLGSVIQHELAQIILHELGDPRLQGLPSITRVKVSPDLGVADVYVTIMGSKGQQTAALNALQHSAGLMRTRLTRAVSLRQAPFLKFHIDEGAKKEIEILELIRKAAEETAEIDRRRAEAEAAAGGSDPPPEQAPTAAVGSALADADGSMLDEDASAKADPAENTSPR
jgi:ribosome-binding factor A